MKENANDKIIEAILFYRGEPVTHDELKKLLKISSTEINSSVEILREKLKNSGLTIIENEDTLTLSTSKESSEIISALRKEELSRELSKAALETLSIILYGDMVSRADIDYIRGVNSSFILRNLMVRGLAERKNHPSDNRKIVYIPSTELLAFMGVARIEDLPEYANMRAEIVKTKEGTGEVENKDAEA